MLGNTSIPVVILVYLSLYVTVCATWLGRLTTWLCIFKKYAGADNQISENRAMQARKTGRISNGRRPKALGTIETRTYDV